MKLSWQSTLLSLTLVHISLHTVSPEPHCYSGSQNLQTSYPLPEETDARYLSTSTTVPKGVQVIVPQMRFSCTGRITSWSAHTLAFALPNFIGHLTHIITFQVWRPSDSTPSSYTLVGSNTLRFSGSELANGITVMNSTSERVFFSFANKTVSHNNEIYFQAGDVLGWFISPQVNTNTPPLKPLFRAPRETEHSTVDMFVNGMTLKSSICSVKETFEVYNSVVPLVSITYQVGGQERSFTVDNQACNTTGTVPTEGLTEMNTPTNTASSSTSSPFPSVDTSQTRPIRIIEIFILALTVVIFLLHITMVVLCALNLSATRDIRRFMKSGITPMTPGTHLPFMLKPPNAKPTKYELVQTLGNYEMVATKSSYETLNRAEKHDRTKDDHLNMLQPGYDMDASPELERSMALNSIRNESKDDLVVSDVDSSRNGSKDDLMGSDSKE